MYAYPATPEGRKLRGRVPVLSGPMLFIFVIDFILMVANGVLAVFLFAA